MSNPTYEALVTRLNDLEQRRAALTAQISADTRQAVQLGLEDFFRSYPALSNFCWTQRADEYDDEGPAEGCQLLRLDAFGERAEFDPYRMYRQHTTSANTPTQSPEWAALADKLQAFVERWEATVMFDLFGTYHYVEATRDGVESFDYWDHDPS
jgi:hypothetical protein